MSFQWLIHLVLSHLELYSPTYSPICQIFSWWWLHAYVKLFLQWLSSRSSRDKDSLKKMFVSCGTLCLVAVPFGESKKEWWWQLFFMPKGYKILICHPLSIWKLAVLCQTREAQNGGVNWQHIIMQICNKFTNTLCGMGCEAIL